MTEFKGKVFPLLFTPRYKDQRKLDVDLIRILTEREDNLKSILSRGLSFQDNFDAVLLDYTSNGSPDTEDAVAHLLGRVPVGRIVYRQDKAGSLYDSGTAFTASNIYLQSDVATVAFKIIVF